MKIQEIVIEPEKIYQNTVFKVKVKAIRYMTCKEMKTRSCKQAKNYTCKQVKGA